MATTGSMHGTRRSSPVVLRGAALAGLLVALDLLVASGLSNLLAWTDRCFPVTRYPALFGCYFATWLLLRATAARWRRLVLLAGSVATALVFDPGFLVLSIAWIVILHRILFGGAAPRVGRALAFVVASYGAFAVAASYDLFPRFLADHPFVARWAYVFAVTFTFRIAWLLHEVRLQRTERIPLLDVLLYFVFAPFFVIVPYMFAIPRCDRFRAALERHDPAIERSGLAMIAWGIGLALAASLLAHIYDPRGAFLASLHARVLGEAIAHSASYYLIQCVLEATAIAAILVGLVRVLGIELGPSFDRPLLARDITDWWRRWNTHFRDLLVELFYYPVVMRLRRTPTRAIVLGCLTVFVVGSVLFHLPKHYFRRGTLEPVPLGLVVENTLMWGLVTAALVVQRRRSRTAPRATRWPVRALRIAFTWALVLVTVVYAGYGAQYLVQKDLTPRPPWSVALEP